jgi:hypothetical protein
MERKTETILTALVTATILVLSAPAAAKVYRWVDENGEVHYSESLPPDFKDKGHDVLSNQGIVLDENQSLTPPPPPPEKNDAGEELPELPRDASGMQRPKALYSAAETQRRMDNFLMLRYESEQEILDAMNVEIKQLNYDKRLLETTRQSMLQAWRGQIREAAHLERSGKPAEEAAYRDISQLQARLAENGRSLDSLKLREDNIRADFQKQLDRYRYLMENWEEESEGG